MICSPTESSKLPCIVANSASLPLPWLNSKLAQRGVQLVEVQHAREREDHELVGLRLSADGHGKPDYPGGQQHVEQYSHLEGGTSYG